MPVLQGLYELPFFFLPYFRFMCLCFIAFAFFTVEVLWILKVVVSCRNAICYVILETCS